MEFNRFVYKELRREMREPQVLVPTDPRPVGKAAEIPRRYEEARVVRESPSRGAHRGRSGSSRAHGVKFCVRGDDDLVGRRGRSRPANVSRGRPEPAPRRGWIPGMLNDIEIRRVSVSLKDFGLQAEIHQVASRGFRIVSVFPEGEQYVIVAQKIHASARPGSRAQAGRGLAPR